MKKNYIIPTTKVVILKESLMLSGSLGEATEREALTKRGFTELDEEDFDASNSGW